MQVNWLAFNLGSNFLVVRLVFITPFKLLIMREARNVLVINNAIGQDATLRADIKWEPLQRLEAATNFCGDFWRAEVKVPR